VPFISEFDAERPVEFVEILSQTLHRAESRPDTGATVYRNGKVAERLGQVVNLSTAAGERLAWLPKAKSPPPKTVQ
jgi:hypothetical protein